MSHIEDISTLKTRILDSMAVKARAFHDEHRGTHDVTFTIDVPPDTYDMIMSFPEHVMPDGKGGMLFFSWPVLFVRDLPKEFEVKTHIQNKGR